MDKTALRYLKKRFRGGKSAIAHAADTVLVWFFAFILAGGAAWGLDMRLALAAILGAAAATAASLLLAALRRRRFEKFIASAKEDMSKSLMLERLLLLSSEEAEAVAGEVFSAVLGESASIRTHGGQLREDGVFCYMFFNHPDTPTDINRLFKAVRIGRDAGAESLCALSASEYTEDAQTFAARIGARLLGREEFLKYISEVPSEEDVERAIGEEARFAYSRERVKNSFISHRKTRAYVICALTTMVWPFVFGFNMIYPIMAAFAWGLAFFSMRAPKESA